jgi:LuxR family maltose regulon positive regulatory protein
MDTSTLIQTKLLIPRTTDNLIERSHLKARLNQGLQRKLILVSAPAGYGKTALISSWLQDVDRPAAWISLDTNDNDLMLFLHYVVTAIRAVFPSACADTLQLIQASQSPPPNYVYARLINDLAAIPDDFILVFDDYHFIHDAAVQNLIAELIEKQPPSLLLVVITRKDPTLPLPRLRAGNKLAEIRQRDLRFRTEEAEMFLQQTLNMRIEPETAVILNKHTEGWVVGMQLLALSLRKSRDPVALLADLNGVVDVFVSEYLLDEVLAQLPERIQAFMLQVAIVDHMSGPLCEALTGVNDPVGGSQAYLEWMEEANLFVIPLDGQQEWYRFHHLFQELLVRQLHKEYPTNEITTLHLRASQWYADQGFIDQALQHALNAGDVDTAVNILEANSQNLLNSLDRHTLERWLSRLPKELIWQRPRLLLAKAWLLVREFRLTALDTTLSAVEAALQTEKAPAETQILRGQSAALRAFTSEFRRHDHEHTLSLAEQASQWLPESERGALSVALMSRAFALHAMGNEAKAISGLQEIIQHPARPSASKIQAFIGLTFLWQKSASLQQMSQVAEQFLAFAAQRSNPNAITASNWLIGCLHYEWNELEQATQHFSVSHDYRYKSNFIASFDAALGLARIRLAQGQAKMAQTIIDELRADTLRLESIDLLGALDSFQAQLWLVNGAHALALRWARSVNLDATFESIFASEVASLTYSRILINVGTTAEVQAVRDFLQLKLAQAEAEHFTLRIIQTNVHITLAYQRLDELGEAINSLEQAVHLAEPGGFVRAFADAGSELRPLLEQLQAQEIAPDYLPMVLAAFPDSPPLSARPSLARATLLTRRETEILQLMEDGLTNQEIAGKLVISPHTVKRHTSNIYGKLGTNGRLAAIYRAKELNIL